MADADAPVALVSRRVAVSNRVWNVCLDHIRDANGNEVRNYVTIAPVVEKPDLITGVGIVPVMDDRIVLLSNYRHPAERALLELPRGFIEPGEDPAVAALRELEEETGLLCDQERLVPLGNYFPEPSTIRGRGMLFAALGCRAGGKPLGDEPGILTAKPYARDKVFAMLDGYEIEDAGTALALHRYREMLVRETLSA